MKPYLIQRKGGMHPKKDMRKGDMRWRVDTLENEVSRKKINEAAMKDSLSLDFQDNQTQLTPEDIIDACGCERCYQMYWELILPKS